MPEARRDLVERSLAFSTRLLRFVQLLRRSTQVEPSVLYQLVRAGSAIGAHNAEAESAISRRQLLTLRAGALREAREAQYWLTLLLDTTDRCRNWSRSSPRSSSAWAEPLRRCRTHLAPHRHILAASTGPKLARQVTIPSPFNFPFQLSPLSFSGLSPFSFLLSPCPCAFLTPPASRLPNFHPRR
jgi:four helix bundle protein